MPERMCMNLRNTCFIGSGVDSNWSFYWLCLKYHQYGIIRSTYINYLSLVKEGY